MVLAAPERKRILNAILNQPQPWTTEQCRVYRELVAAEYMHEIGDSDPMDGLVDYLLQESSAKFCGHLLAQGVPLERAMEEASKLALADAERTKASLAQRGEVERARRRRRREAVTAFRGAEAVTTGRLGNCIVCDAPIGRRVRADAAYCSPACRQTAYRRRRKAAT